MAPRPEELESLWREAIVSADAECPTSDVLARGAAGELTHAERKALAEHLALCESCAGLVRLYPDVKDWADRASARRAATARGKGPRVAWLLAAAAVVVLGASLAVVTRLRPAESPSYRTGSAAEIRSLVDGDRPLPRAAFRLRWTPGPAGSRYSVLVARENLAPITQERGLASPEFLVEERLLANLPPGSRVVWRVWAEPPGAPALASPSFVTMVE
jgi:hypothetical protein